MEERANRNVVLMAFGLPVMTTAIVIGSMYAGHLITTRSDRPTNVNVSAATPRIDVNVPQALPPTIAVNATAPMVDVHVPQMPPPTVTVNPPAMPAPHITVNPPPASVTVIKEEKYERLAERTPERPLVQTVAVAPAIAALPGSLKPATATPPSATPSSATPAAPPEAKPVEQSVHPDTGKSSEALIPVESPAHSQQDPSLDTLYAYATKYIAAYCNKRGLDPESEAKKWNRNWKSNVEQAINDNIDSGEQSYINRQVIAKRDYFNLESTTPEKVVEACRILLRYRDGQLAWMQAMRDAMTRENLRKTVAFLAAGPR